MLCKSDKNLLKYKQRKKRVSALLDLEIDANNFRETIQLHLIRGIEEYHGLRKAQ